jgi:mannose-6-phosphate isomerase-like protein (cupin superfamily)
MSILPYHENIEYDTLNNQYYRNVVCTISDKLQLVLMNINVNEDLHMEVHPHTAQFIRIEKGLGIATINNLHYGLSDGVAIIVPPNTPHRIENVGKTPLKLYTIYTPPEHKDGLIQKLRPKY